MVKDQESWQNLVQTQDSASRAAPLFLSDPGVVVNTSFPPDGTEIGEKGAGWGAWGRGPGLVPAPAHTPASPDVDECLEQLDECLYNQICENSPGRHHCGCPRGYWSQGPGLPCRGMGTPAP